MIEYDGLKEKFFRYNVADERGYVTPFGYLIDGRNRPVFGVEPGEGIVSEQVLYWRVK